MARYVIDADTLLQIAAGTIAVDETHQLVAPASVRSQALTVLLGRVNAGDLSEREALRLHERLTEIKLRLLNDRVSRRTAWNLARAHGWPNLRDAEYLALVTLQADALVTVDERLAALAADLVEVRPVEALSCP